VLDHLVLDRVAAGDSPALTALTNCRAALGLSGSETRPHTVRGAYLKLNIALT
jgi:hypothetical protein